MPRKPFEEFGNEELIKRRALVSTVFCPKLGITINDCNEKDCSFHKGILEQNGKTFVLCSYSR